MARNSNRYGTRFNTTRQFDPLAQLKNMRHDMEVTLDPRTRPGHVITLDQMPEEKRQEMLRLYGRK